MDHDSDVTSSLAPPTPSADSPTATEAETANQTADTSAASHGGGSFSSESETSKLTTANKPSTAQTSLLSESPEATGEPSQVTSAPRSSAQNDGATPPEEEEGEEDEDREEDDGQELGNMNNFHLQNGNVLKLRQKSNIYAPQSKASS